MGSFAPDAIGFIFYPQSPRYVTGEIARSIGRVLPDGILKVGVFVDPDWEQIRRLACSVPLDVIQWHGKTLTEELRANLVHLKIPVIEVKKITPEMVPPSIHLQPAEGVSYLLVEGASSRSPGGNGQDWDHSLLRGISCPIPLILSGGLNDNNVYNAISAVRPFGVDVSSGVESSPGKKSYDRLFRFFSEVKRYV
ncbi:MAG: phosphoribosylanthranilate isomerase [Leptospirales bacterium]